MKEFLMKYNICHIRVMTRMFVNAFEKLTTSHAYSLYEDDLREMLPKLSSTVGKIIALGESILDIENDYDFMAFKDEIDVMLPDTDQRLKTVVVIVLFCAYKVCMHIYTLM